MEKIIKFAKRLSVCCLLFVLLCSIMTVSGATYNYTVNPEFNGTVVGVENGVFKLSDVVEVGYENEPAVLTPGSFWVLSTCTDTSVLGVRAIVYYHGLKPGTAYTYVYATDDLDKPYVLKVAVRVTVVAKGEDTSVDPYAGVDIDISDVPKVWGSDSTEFPEDLDSGAGIDTSGGTGTDGNVGTDTNSGTGAGSNTEIDTSTGTDTNVGVGTDSNTGINNGGDAESVFIPETLADVQKGDTNLPSTCLDGHDYMLSSYIEATKYITGYLEYTCQTCDYSKRYTVPKLTSTSCDHNWKYIKTDSTCTTKGSLIEVCTKCGMERFHTLYKLLEHDWVTKTIQPTTTSAGKRYKVCSVCGAEKDIEVLSKKLHNGSGITTMAKLSKEEIVQLLDDTQFQTSSTVFDVEPSMTYPYVYGKLSLGYEQDAANRLSALRRIAGLGSVSVLESKISDMQYGSMVNALNDEMDHHPDKPALMSESDFQKGYNICKSSNLHSGGSNLIYAVDSWIDDSGENNEQVVGHRRWFFDPRLTKVCFGMVGSYSSGYPDINSYAERPQYDYVSWPSSGYFPNSLLPYDTHWSVFFNPDYCEYSPDAKLTMTRKSDGRVWNFSGDGGADGKYHIGAYGYGDGWSIVFIPNDISDSPDEYTVTVTGLQMCDGTTGSITYSFEVFNNKVPFYDVSNSSPAYKAIRWAYTNGITTGVTETMFKPNDTCTRGQVATFLWRSLGEEQLNGSVTPFSDVASTSPFYDATLWAVQQGITKGTTATTFSPGQTCTNAHVLTFLWRAAGEPMTGIVHDGSTYYADAVAWAKMNGIVSSTDFSPNDPASRADIVTYLYNYSLKISS